MMESAKTEEPISMINPIENRKSSDIIRKIMSIIFW